MQVWEPCDPTGSRAGSFHDVLLPDNGSGPPKAGPPLRCQSLGSLKSLGCLKDEASSRTAAATSGSMARGADGGDGVDTSSGVPPPPAGLPFPPAPECGARVPATAPMPAWTPSPLPPRHTGCRPICPFSNSGCPFGNSGGYNDCGRLPGVAQCAPAFGWSPHVRRLNSSCPDLPASAGSAGPASPVVRVSRDAVTDVRSTDAVADAFSKLERKLLCVLPVSSSILRVNLLGVVVKFSL